MTADVELLPLPDARRGESVGDWANRHARACVLRHTAAQAAEIEALRKRLRDTAGAEQELVTRSRQLDDSETRAERLAEALKGLTDATIRRVYLPEKVFRAALAVAKDVLLQEQE